ncbi:hypothetical protein EV702DRAFT_1181662 [Suillus placidus]|uniref:CxC2-like cysteine cluster KDZ transposase-associated domain-containing protein n=1 Tax=Suillus placidus TaxID=48579 RepID=A0A9P6ZKH9_9AGAM|nr:hypothetical protein EV702DRAFT_1181662 [Suillus placidus]
MFATQSLKQLRLQVQLGYPIGEEFIHTNGIHKITLDYCGCHSAQTHAMQLLCVAYFPATTSEPQTAATFQILKQYHLLLFESKASGYEFYRAITRLTDNTSLHARKDRYKAFLRMVQEWRHLKMLKCAGRGHDPTGVEGMMEGECTILCPACPQPGKNLPDDWQDRRAISKDSMDPGLSHGWAYFVEEAAYKSHLQQYSSKLQEVLVSRVPSILCLTSCVQKSTCSSHNTVKMAGTKASQGLAATDLQKGERYTNMDYLFFSTLGQWCVDVFNVSYNIACQWHKHLWQHMSTMPAHLQLDHASKLVRFFVPKCHLPAHVSKCQSMFSFNFSKNVGRTDGEAPERGWSKINPVASSATLLHKMEEANEEHQAHANAFEELNRALNLETTTALGRNPNDLSVHNPFKTKVSTITQAAVRLKLVEMEARQLQEGNNVLLHPDISPSVFIATGIDLESEQRRFKSDLSSRGAQATDRQKTILIWQQSAFQRKVEAWKRVQLLYTPAAQLLSSRMETGGNPDNPEDIKLFLPSSLTADTASCSHHLLTIEWELRIAQAGDALDEIRQKARAAAAAEKYRAAHAALSCLVPALNKVGWNFKFRSLNNKDDVRGMTVPKKGESEGRRQLSWILVVEGVGDDEDEVVQDGLWVEWCKACTRKMRWKEEIELLEEEMPHLRGLTGAEKEGVVAYATRQAHIHCDLSAKFEISWAQYLTAPP